jgi:predicted ATP-grasp superfamily ATP-dependent carboligase
LEDYAPYTDVIKTGNDLNKSKKSYPKVAGGDNPMNLADKIKEELSTLYKEYKG